MDLRGPTSERREGGQEGERGGEGRGRGVGEEKGGDGRGGEM